MDLTLCSALAQLLLWCDTKHLDPAAIPRVGYMILSETEHLTTVLQELRKANPRRLRVSTKEEFMLQVAHYSSAVPPVCGLTDADPDRVREKVRTRMKAFYRMQSETDEFTNPFAQWTEQSPPPFVCYILWCIGELSTDA